MANRRMFSLDVIDTDKFLEMPISTQALYFHLGMRADDDGFVSSPNRITALTGASNDDLKLLFAKGFVIPFQDGVCVIVDWKMNNYIQKDRYHKTRYSEHLNQLKVDENGRYNTLETECIQDVYNSDTEVRLGKVRLGKDRLYIGEAEEKITQKSSKPKPQKHKYGEYKNVLLSDEDMEKLKSEFPNDWQERIERLSDYIACKGDKYKNHLVVIRNWAKREPKGSNTKQQSESSVEALNEKWGVRSTVL